MRLLYLLLLLCAAVTAAPEVEEIEGLETLVALNAPESEENDGETKKARLTFFDDPSLIIPTKKKPIDTKEPQLRYVSPKSTTTAAPTTTTVETSTAAATTTTASTTAASTTVPSTESTPSSTTSSVTETSETLLEFPVPEVFAAPTTSTAPETTTAAVEKKVEKLVEIATQKPILIPIPLPDKEILQAIVETSEPILIQLPYLPKVAGVLTSQSIHGNPWGTESISDQKPPLSAEITVPPPVEIGSELDMGEASPFLPEGELSRVINPSVEEKKKESKMSPEEMERAQLLMTALRAMKSEVEETLRQINEGEKTVLQDVNASASSTTVVPSTTTTSASSTTTSIPTTTTTTSAPSTTTSAIPSTTTSARPTTTRRPLPVDEVRSTEAVQIDSEGEVVKIKVTPNNDAVVVVDNSTTKQASKRLIGYTKNMGRVVDNDHTKVTKVFKHVSHDNSFLPSEEGEVRPKKVLPKKRHLIQNDEEPVKKVKRRLRKRIKKVVSSPPTTTESTTVPTTTTTTTTLPPPTPSPVAARRFVARAAEVIPQFQVSPAAAQPPVVHAAPIYRPQYYPTLTPQPAYYPPATPQPLLYTPQPVVQPYQPLFQQPFLQPQQLSVQQPQQLPILRYEPVVYYRPVYGRKKREAMRSKHEFLFRKEQKEMNVRKGDESRFSRLHSVISPSLSTRKHGRVFEKRDETVTVRKVEEKKNEEKLNLPKSPVLRKSSSEPHKRTKRVKRSADLTEVNRELDELERILLGSQRGPVQMGEREERHTGVDELASELEMIEKMKKRGKEEIEEEDLMEEGEEEEEEIPEKEEEEKATPSYKKPLPTLEELKSLEDSVQVDHEQMKKHPQGELKLNKGERPKLFSHGRTITEQIRGAVSEADYEYDAQIADSFALPADDHELEELFHARLRAAELAPVSPTAAPLRKRRHRTTPSQREEAEVEVATKRPKRRRTTTTTETPTTTRPPRPSRRRATIIPNFHPKEASSDTDSLASLPNLLEEEEETTTLRARGIRRNRHTREPQPSTTTTTTTQIPETTTTRRVGRPPRVLPKKEASSFSLPSGGSRLFYDRDSSSQVVIRSPPHAPPTLTPPTLIPQSALSTISPNLSIDELAGLPREALLAELKRLTDQLEGREEDITTPSTSVLPPPPPRDEDITDEEDRELMEAIRKGERKETDPFEFVRRETTTTTTTEATTTEKEEDLFSFALPAKQGGEKLTIEDLVVSDAVNEASIGQDLDKILADVGVGDNSIGTRKRAIEAIMEFKKKKNGESRAKKCQPTSCTQEKIPKDDLELVSQLQAVNMKHPLAKDGKFSLFATNKKSYYILPDGRVLVVNEQSKLARTNSGEELHLDEEEEYEESASPYSTDISPTTTTPVPITEAPRRRTTTAVPHKKRVKTRPPTTTTPFPIEGSDYEENEVESATIGIRPKIPPLPPHLPPPKLPEMKKVVIPWRTTIAPFTTTTEATTTRKVYIHDGGIEPSQVSVFATPRTPAKSSIVVYRDEEGKHYPRHQDSGIARREVIVLGTKTLENNLGTSEAEMSREELIKYLETIDLAKTFGGKSLDEQTPNDEKFDRAVSKTAEDEYADETEYEDSVTETESTSLSSSSQLNAGPKSVDDIDLRKWFTIGKDSAARRKKGDGIAESILEAASEVPEEEVAEDEFLADESANLFPDDFVRVLRSVAGGEKVPMRMLRRLGLRLRAARLRRH